MTEGVILRARDGDLKDLAALRYQWRVEEAGERGDGLDSFEAKFREWYDAHRGTHVGYLVKLEGVAVGCAWLHVIDRVPGPEKFVRKGGMLQSVYIEPPRRNLGLGAMLISRIIDDAEALGLEYLMVHPSSASFDFYRRLGFAYVGTLLELRFI